MLPHQSSDIVGAGAGRYISPHVSIAHGRRGRATHQPAHGRRQRAFHSRADHGGVALGDVVAAADQAMDASDADVDDSDHARSEQLGGERGFFGAQVLSVGESYVSRYLVARLQQDDVDRQIEGVRHLLNAATIALTAGVLQIFFEYRWVAALLFPVPTTEANKRLADFGSTIAASVTFAGGSAFSLFLVGCFVPAAAIIKWRVDRTNYRLAREERLRFDAIESGSS